jgi:hypothetical protein
MCSNCKNVQYIYSSRTVEFGRIFAALKIPRWREKDVSSWKPIIGLKGSLNEAGWRKKMKRNGAKLSPPSKHSNLPRHHKADGRHTDGNGNENKRK